MKTRLEQGRTVSIADRSDDGVEAAQYKITPEMTALLGPAAAHVGSDASSKTIRMHDRDFVFDDGDIGCTLTDMAVTVTKMFYPTSGQPYLQIFFNYSVTSRGWRTGSGLGPEAAGVLHGLSFLNRDGGTMWAWGFPYDGLRVDCGWIRHPRTHHIVSNVDVGWFELWKKVSYSMYGTLYSC
ncbi:MAG: hypothetical protein H6523_16005 [Mycolicibacterium sp.]|jgi:hypothetical protein|uniref:Uncharacterized protein n=1 Tax=Mycolicibacterium insubricum TaxID=444597 RepID=A0A1X0DNP7_9MYCO|nr:hypothetical protein [Mycolicibacterium insubricum]MCB9441739.1 hypothetical protein [Mycolicibacterium sp.]MCV7083391.1 hypothetical protein [Mycolicibacterium insubricum]ORA73769.1 hypothetical protein BST26_00910 [Mycolicibacterium insubricum]